MKVRVERTELAEAVAWLASITSKRSYHPALHGIRIGAVDGLLRLQATDLELAGEVEITAAVDEPGAALPSAAVFHAVTSRLPDAPVMIAAEDDGITLQGGRVTARVRTLMVDDFPALPTVEATATVTIPSTVVESIHRRISPAIWTGEARPILTGVYVVVDGGRLLAAATDSYQMHRLDTDLDGEGKAAANIPPAVFSALAKLGEPVHAAFADEMVEFAAPDRRLVTSLIAGQFPDPDKFYPDALPDPVQVPRDELVESLKRCAALVAGVDNVPVTLSASDGLIGFAVAHQDVGEITDAMSADASFDTVAVHPSRLLRAVEAVGSERLDLRFAGAMKPIYVSDPAGGPVRALVMPMRPH